MENSDAFVINTQGTRWWIIRNALEDGNWGTGPRPPVLLSVHGTDGHALQEWKLEMTNMSQFLWLYAAGESQACVMYDDRAPVTYTLGQLRPKPFTALAGWQAYFGIVMHDGSSWHFDVDKEEEPTANFSLIHTPPHGKPSVRSTFMAPRAMTLIFLPSETGLCALPQHATPPEWPRYRSPVFRLNQSGSLVCIHEIDPLLRAERRRIGWPIYVNRHDDLWVVTSTKKPDKEELSHSTLWKITHLPRWRIWLQRLNEQGTLR